jgi:acid phosphatase type 7
VRRAIRPAAAAFLLLAACGEKKKAASFDFAAYGDCRHKTEVHRKIAKNMAAAAPKFVLVSGDLVDDAEDEAEWTTFRDIVKDLRAVSKYYCSFGDHDGTSEPGSKNYFLKEMGQKENYFDVVEGDYHVFILDSRSEFDDPKQVEWLEKTAAASKSKHKFAVFHRSPYMVDEKRNWQADSIRPKIHPRLVKLKFCAAFCGHQHAYYTALRDGLRYVVTAGGGAPLKNIDMKLGQPGDQGKSFHHFVGFNNLGTRIQGRVYDMDGYEVPEFAFTLCEH